MTADIALPPTTAARFAELALANVVREFPNKLDHVMESVADVRRPRELHPVFYGSFDFHSCVHMHWLLARLRRLHPALPQRDAIAALFERHFTPDAIAGEVAYVERPASRSFSRTYGWAWCLELAHELARARDADAARWAATFAPLARAFVARYLDYLPIQHYPLRTGLHPNSAFGLLLALDYARDSGETALAQLCESTARAWFADDADAPAQWEPSGADFLSPTLMEAMLMRRVLPPPAFAAWLDRFLPAIARRAPASLFEPARVTDRSDPFIVHLDGLNLSRAWCFAGIADALPPADPRIAILVDAADRHRAAGMAGLGSGDYMGEHWLATFALLAHAREGRC